MKVHYPSPLPGQMSALAYTQGASIHVGPGAEYRLPHEAWHVVEQRKGYGAGAISHIGLSTSEPALAVERELLAKRTPL